MGVLDAALRTVVPADATKRARLLVYRSLPEPRRRRILAGVLLRQAGVCARSGSPLYQRLLETAAEDVTAGGPCWRVLTGHERPGSVLALRFLGAVHRLVLAGEAPELAPYYPSVSDPARADDCAPAFLATVERHAERLRDLVEQPVQTNEVSRCAVLLCGFLLVARESGLPLRVLEVGASAGMNLLWDRYFYRAGEETWGDPASPVRLEDVYEKPCPLFDVSVEVAERRGCDLVPLDVRSEETTLTLKSLIWSDQVERFGTFERAISIARADPPVVDRASAPDWLEAQLGSRSDGVATVVFQSYVQQFYSAITAERARRTLRRAGRAADGRAPLYWMRFEPGHAGGMLRLLSWPGEHDRLVAIATPHGRRARWVLDESETPSR